MTHVKKAQFCALYLRWRRCNITGHLAQWKIYFVQQMTVQKGTSTCYFLFICHKYFHKCCVPFCKTMRGHKFPKDAQLKNTWIKSKKSKTDKTLRKPTKHSVVCKSHFKPDLKILSENHVIMVNCVYCTCESISCYVSTLTIASSLAWRLEKGLILKWAF